MKNKKLLYVLLPATLLVWGMIVFRIWNGVSGQENKVENLQHAIGSVSVQQQPAVFTLHRYARDPFLGKQQAPVATPANDIKPIPKAQKTKTSKQETAWPSINYGGLIKNQQSNKQVALISINGEPTFLRSGESSNGIKLTKVFKDSVELVYGNEKRFFHK